MQLEPITPSAAADLGDAAAAPPRGAPSKEESGRRLDVLVRRLDELQAALHAEARRAVLVVLQGRDTAGKDGAIRGVFGPLNPQGVSVTAFGAPSSAELAHDFLWRIHREIPPRGTLGVFNRSHYEDVLAVRVRRLAPEETWRPRYEQINQFESMLAGNGVTVVKFFLHVSREEQRERLLARLEDPRKYWKFNPGDLEDRARWDEYTAAAEEMLARTSTVTAPWYVVPADKKYLRDVLVAQVVVRTLEALDPRYPPAPQGLERFREALR
jgi:PPK2 family polyphosphate:nucleotide phosphotransferase